jgi:hypothetical protein
MAGIILNSSMDIIIIYFWKSVPIHLLWLSPIMTFVGGGEAVTGMMFYAVGCDITTEANRSSSFPFF